MRILITGASGFMGSHLAAAFAAGHELFCAVRRKGALPPDAGLHEVPLDLGGESGWDELPRGIDAIWHLAQPNNAPFPEGAWPLFNVNAGSTVRLAEYARRSGARQFVFASSGSVYNTASGVLREDDPCKPADFYGFSKLAAEQALDWYRGYCKVVVLRFFAPYGPGQLNRMIPTVVERVRRGEPVLLRNGGEPRNRPIHIDDVVRLFGQVLEYGESATVNVAGPETVSIKDIAGIAGAYYGREPVFQIQDAPQHMNLVADTARMNALFRMDGMVTPDEGIRAVAAWIEKNR